MPYAFSADIYFLWAVGARKKKKEEKDGNVIKNI